VFNICNAVGIIVHNDIQEVLQICRTVEALVVTFAEDQLGSAALLTSYLILILCKSTLADTLSEADSHIHNY